MKSLQKGYTLIELLAVLLIIGFVVGLAAINVGASTGTTLAADAKTFVNSASLVAEEAVLGRQQWGIDLYREFDDSSESRIGYRWLLLTEDRWQPATIGDMGSESLFPAGTDVLFELDGSEVPVTDKKPYTAPQVVDAEEQELPEDKALKADILLFSSGEVSRFQLTLRQTDHPDTVRRVWADSLGRFHLEHSVDAG